jgi:hypothetical protein
MNAEKRPSEALTIAIGVLGILSVTFGAAGAADWYRRRHASDPTTEELATAETARASRAAESRFMSEASRGRRADGQRSLKIQDSPHAPIPVFPTREGLSDWTSASSTGKEAAAAVSFRENSGILVAPGTACQVLNAGLLVTQVRLLGGDHVGEKGFVPSEWLN